MELEPEQLLGRVGSGLKFGGCKRGGFTQETLLAGTAVGAQTNWSQGVSRKGHPQKLMVTSFGIRITW